MKLFSAVLLATLVAALVTAAVHSGFDPARPLPAAGTVARCGGTGWVVLRDDPSGDQEWSGESAPPEQGSDCTWNQDPAGWAWFLVGFVSFLAFAPARR